MRIMNMQDGIMKAPLVQQAHEQAPAVAKATEGTTVPSTQELARQADETVRETSEAENERIREEEERRQEEERRRHRRPASDADAVEDSSDAKPAESSPDEDGASPRRIDITV